jgi:gluconate kinase
METVIIALYGPMGSGKSTVAQALAEMPANKGVSKQLRFADPLYRVANLCRDWRYKDSDRAAFELFDLTADILGGKGTASFMDVSAAVYERLPVLAKELESFHLMGVKPRAFLQQTGDLFRGYDKDCFATYLTHSILVDLRRNFETWCSDRDRIEAGGAGVFTTSNKDEGPAQITEVPPFRRVYVVDDLRFPNEFAEMSRLPQRLKMAISEDMNVVLRMVKLEISPEDAAMRVAARDQIPFAKVMESTAHQSEGGLESQEFDAVVDATQPLDDVIDDVWCSVTGRTRMVKGTNLIDLTSLRSS